MEAATPVTGPAAGVGGITVEEIQDQGLRCFFSRLPSRETLSQIPAVESALAFHHTLQTLFSQAMVIPFRFPTVVEAEEELLRELREKAPRYSESLAQLRDMAQMEVHINEPTQTTAEQAATGSEYLRSRQTRAGFMAAAAGQFRAATRHWTMAWRERPVKSGIRCYALVRREAIAEFQGAAQALLASLPGSRLSGPWPPVEFLRLEEGH
jgi:hypothetical protein